MKILLTIALALTMGCAGYTPRESAAATFTVVVGAAPMAVSYISALIMNVIAYPAAWIRGDEEGSTRIWFSSHFGPDYAS